MQDFRKDKAFFIPNSYRQNGRFNPRDVLEISSEYPMIVGVFGSEKYFVFSSMTT
jgi:hypothetical protein